MAFGGKSLRPPNDLAIGIGIGIAEDDIPHIFEPFFSTKQATSGIGLGLAIVHGIIKTHNGRIEVESEPGKGTTISIILPTIRI